MKAKLIKKIGTEYGTLIALLIIVAVFGIVSPKAFLSVKNAINISRQMAALTVISIGATMVMAVGEFDLSIGSMASFGGVLAAILAVAGVPVTAAFLITLAVCAVIGLVNGFIVARFRVLSFITTLGVSTVLDGFIYRLTGGATVFENIPKSFSLLGTLKIFNIPLLSIIMVVLVVIFAFIMKNTVLGPNSYAIGSAIETARLSGINVKLYKMLAFTICAILAGFTGILVASRVGSANTTAGAGFFLKSYAAVYIGCTVSKRGLPGILGTFVGAAILSVLANGLTILQIPSFLQDIITGCIIVAAVIAQKVGKGEKS